MFLFKFVAFLVGVGLVGIVGSCIDEHLERSKKKKDVKQ